MAKGLAALNSKKMKNEKSKHTIKKYQKPYKHKHTKRLIAFHFILISPLHSSFVASKYLFQQEQRKCSVDLFFVDILFPSFFLFVLK